MLTLNIEQLYSSLLDLVLHEEVTVVNPARALCISSLHEDVEGILAVRVEWYRLGTVFQS